MELCGLLLDYCDGFYQLFGLSFWRHPFTAEDSLVSKWCHLKFLKICSVKEKNSSTYWLAWQWVHFQQIFIFENCSFDGPLLHKSNFFKKNKILLTSKKWRSFTFACHPKIISLVLSSPLRTNGCNSAVQLRNCGNFPCLYFVYVILWDCGEWNARERLKWFIW